MPLSNANAIDAENKQILLRTRCVFRVFQEAGAFGQNRQEQNRSEIVCRTKVHTIMSVGRTKIVARNMLRPVISHQRNKRTMAQAFPW